jgi:hypothetical protein
MKNLIDKFIEYCKSIRYDDIKIINVYGIPHKYGVQFPSEMENVKVQILGKLKPGSTKWKQWQFRFDDIYAPQNRIHFETGLPEELKGLGLGYKMYKALVMHLGYAESEANATDAATRIWEYMLEDEDLIGYGSESGHYLVFNPIYPNREEVLEKWMLFHKIPQENIFTKITLNDIQVLRK